jgi:hypothetical protein
MWLPVTGFSYQRVLKYRNQIINSEQTLSAVGYNVKIKLYFHVHNSSFRNKYSIQNSCVAMASQKPGIRSFAFSPYFIRLNRGNL